MNTRPAEPSLGLEFLFRADGAGFWNVSCRRQLALGKQGSDSRQGWYASRFQTFQKSQGILTKNFDIQIMQVMLDFCVVPLGVGVSLSRYVTEYQKVLATSGLNYQMHAYGTNVEGDWNEVMAVVKNCHKAVHALGAPRITTSIRLGTRTDRQQSMDDKIASVKLKLDQE